MGDGGQVTRPNGVHADGRGAAGGLCWKQGGPAICAAWARCVVPEMAPAVAPQQAGVFNGMSSMAVSPAGKRYTSRYHGGWMDGSCYSHRGASGASTSNRQSHWLLWKARVSYGP